jgi:hypothetical protein
VHLHAATVVFERALVVFMLFEILDGVYSLSGGSVPGGRLGAVDQVVVGAGAIVIGGVFLARLATFVDQAGALERLRFLKAGAAYVLGALAVLLWASLIVPIPSAIVGWYGTVIIGAAFLSSLPWRRWRRRRTRHAAGSGDPVGTLSAEPSAATSSGARERSAR